MAEDKQEATPKNKVTIEDVGPCKKKVIIEIPEEAIAAVADEQYSTLQKDAEVPGFRKGRAPQRLLEKRFGKEVVNQIKLKLLADSSDAALKDNELSVLADPDIDYENIELPESGPLTYDFEIEVSPEFELPKLDDIKVNKKNLEVNDEQVDSELAQIQKYSGTWAPREKASKVELDDQVIGDVLIKVEGVDEEEKLDNTEIFVRPNGFVGSVSVEKLDELLVGAKVGDKKETTIELPKTYFKEEYRGKKVDIKIEVEDIKWIKPAELNEEFFSRFGVETADELKEKIKESLQQKLEQQINIDMSEQIYKYLLDNAKFDLPTDVVAAQANTILQRQFTTLMQRGLPQEKIKEEMENLRASSEEKAKEQLKIFFIMDKVADKFDIQVSEEEINGHIAQMAVQQGQRPEKMREDMTKNGSLAQFGMQIRENKCMAKLLDSAKVTEVAPEEKTAKKTTKKAAPKADDSEKKTVKKTKKKTTKKKTD